MNRSTAQRTTAPGQQLLPAAARGALISGGLLSLFFTLYAGRHNASVMLAALFAAWVVSPFAGYLLVVRSATRQHPTGMVRALLANSIVVSAVSAGIYGAVAFAAPTHHTAFAFLVVPAASWLAIATFVIAARMASRR